MADDDLEDFDFDDGDDEQDDIDYENHTPSRTHSHKARRELEKRMELKRLRELLDYTDFDEEL